MRKYTADSEENVLIRNRDTSFFISHSEIAVVPINKAGIKFSFNKSYILTFTVNKSSILNNRKLNKKIIEEKRKNVRIF